jgi:hypothetical protein
VANKGVPMKRFATIEEVEKADKEQLARWYRFLPSAETPADQKIMKRIAERFEKLSGMTAELRENDSSRQQSIPPAGFRGKVSFFRSSCRRCENVEKTFRS